MVRRDRRARRPARSLLASHRHTRAHAGRLAVWLSARSSTDSAISAEDVAAETWLTAAAKIKTFSGSSQNVGSSIDSRAFATSHFDGSGADPAGPSNSSWNTYFVGSDLPTMNPTH